MTYIDPREQLEQIADPHLRQIALKTFDALAARRGLTPVAKPKKRKGKGKKNR